MSSIPKSRYRALLLLACSLLIATASAATQVRKPKLIVAIVVDQFRYDYLTRFREQYTGGLDLLMKQGAVFTSARYEHFPTVTAVGHSTVLTGATPSLSGIIANVWYDRTEGKDITSVSDKRTHLLGGDGIGSSPHRLLVSTVGDELRSVHPDSKVVGISLKDRSAILPAGHMANGAYWFDPRSGHFVSSSYYFPELPGWVRDFNSNLSWQRYCGAEWLKHKLPAKVGPQLYSAIAESPFGSELIEEMAESAIVAEQLGQRNATDLLTISFSSNDYIGHAWGPDSAEVREVSIHTDRVLARLFQFLGTRVNMDNVLIVLTADHGVSPTPEVLVARSMPGGRMSARAVQDRVRAALVKRYGEGGWILSPYEHSLYLNHDLIHERGLDLAEVNRVAALAALEVPHVFRVYTREQLTSGMSSGDAVDRQVRNGFLGSRGADVYILLEPYWVLAGSGASHGTAFSYDSHVPVIFWGHSIRPGVYYQNITVNDIAPTLAAILEVESPSGSVGRVLAEMFTIHPATSAQ